MSDEATSSQNNQPIDDELAIDVDRDKLRAWDEARDDYDMGEHEAGRRPKFTDPRANTEDVDNDEPEMADEDVDAD